jgi:chromosome segregation ATPase
LLSAGALPSRYEDLVMAQLNEKTADRLENTIANWTAEVTEAHGILTKQLAEARDQLNVLSSVLVSTDDSDDFQSLQEEQQGTITELREALQEQENDAQKSLIRLESMERKNIGLHDKLKAQQKKENEILGREEALQKELLTLREKQCTTELKLEQVYGEIDALKSTIAQSQEDVLSEELSALKAKYRETEASLVQVQSEAEAHEKSNLELTALQLEHQEMMVELGDAREKASQACDQVNALEESLAVMEREAREHEVSRATLENELTDKLQPLTENNRELEELLKAERAQIASQEEELATCAEKEAALKEELQKVLNSTQVEMARHEEELAACTEKEAALNQELLEKVEALAVMTERQTHLTEDKSVAIAQMGSLQNDVLDKDNAIKSLKERIVQLNKKRDELQEKVKRGKALKKQAEDEREELATKLEFALAFKENQSRELQEQAEKLQHASSKIADLRKELAQLAEEKESAQKEVSLLSQEHLEVQKRLDVANAAIESLRSEVLQQSSDSLALQGAMDTQLEQYYDALAKLESATEENLALTSSVEEGKVTLEASEERALNLEESLAVLQRDINRQSTDYAAARSQVSELNTELSHTITQQQETQALLSEARGEHLTLQSIMEEKESELHALLEDMARMKELKAEEQKSFSREKKQLQDECTQAQSEIDALQQSNARLNDLSQSLRAQMETAMAALNSELEVLRNQHHVTEAVLEESKNEKAGMANMLAKKEQTLSRLNQHNLGLTQSLSEARHELEKAQEANDQEQSENEALVARIDTMMAKAKMAESDFSKAQAEIAAQAKRIQAFEEAAVQEKQRTSRLLQETVNSLQDELHSLVSPKQESTPGIATALRLNTIQSVESGHDKGNGNGNGSSQTVQSSTTG